MDKVVEFKGTKDGIVLQIRPFNHFEQVIDSIKTKLDKSQHFFSGATIIGVEGLIGEEKNRSDLYHLLTETYDFEVKSLDTMMKIESHVEDIETEEIKEVEEVQEPSIQLLDYNEFDTKIVRHNLRSGMSVSYDGNIVIIGDVNPGAEVTAGGNVIVMGKLRGMVHAGKFGDKDTYVIASKLLPTQIRITNVIARAPEGENIDELRPEIAYLKSGKLCIDEL